MKQKRRRTTKTRGVDIDAALFVMVAVAAPGETFTQKQIADACGCSTVYIGTLEKQALRKLRPAFERRLKPATSTSLRPCQGRLIRNEASSSDFTEAYVCCWCGATFDAMTDISLGQVCTRSYAPLQGAGLGDLMNQQVRGADAVAGARAARSRRGAGVGQRPTVNEPVEAGRREKRIKAGGSI